MPPVRELAGQVFGRITVLGDRKIVKHQSVWWCRCECGVEKDIPASYLLTGDTRSCGCLGKDIGGDKNPNHRHGLVDSKEYRSWSNMIQRCSNSSLPVYKYYGGRGIRVCEEWVSFQSFISDMGLKPTPKHTIDRIDPNGNYCKENCRWVTMKVQQHNKRNNVLITAYGKTQTESAWAEELGVFRTSIQSRRRRGFTGDILVAPSRNMLEYKGPRCVKYMEDYTKEELQQFKKEVAV